MGNQMTYEESVGSHPSMKPAEALVWGPAAAALQVSAFSLSARSAMLCSDGRVWRVAEMF